MHQTFDSANFKKICNKLCRIDKDLHALSGNTGIRLCGQDLQLFKA